MFIRMGFLLPFSMLVLSITACRITDHDDEGGGITPADIHIPTSGYEQTDPAKLPKLEFDADTIDAGIVAQGTVITRTYGFVNSGGSDLIIADVRSTCGCTIGKNWPRHPIKPGERGSIDVSFDSEGRNGVQVKSVSIVSNAVPSTHMLILRSEVTAPTN
jgi:Protein of unknown function (DUF1573)